MISKIRIPALLLAVLTVLAAFLFTGCEGQTAADTTAAEIETTEPVSEETKDPLTDTSENFTFVKDGVANVVVVRPDADSTASTAVQAAMAVRTALMKYADKVEITTDWSKDGTHDASAIEIIVGMTNYDETANAVKTLGYGDYTVQADGNKIVLLGYTDSAMTYAGTAFKLLLSEYAKENENGKYDVVIPRAEIAKNGTKDKTINQLPVYEGGTFGSFYDAGDDCEEVIITKTTVEEYQSYLKKLESSGYKCYTTNQITDNYFATYYNDKYTLNLGFYKYEKSVRIIQEEYQASTLIGLEADNKYTVVTTSQITSVGLQYNDSTGSPVCNGLSVLIRLTDGRFIVVDGGFNRAATCSALIKAMKAQSKDYLAQTGGKIKIAAWIITHAHGDHQGMINGQYSTIKSNGIVVERFLVNFLSESERTKSISTYSSNWTSAEGSGWTKTYTAAAALGSDVVAAHVGQVFWLADLKLEVLYTIESYAPAATNALNTTSLIMKMTFTDPATKKQTVYMSTGDATGPGFLICYKMYGSYLKSDIVQVAHHGYTTWGTENGTTSAYIAMAPATLLWPQGTAAYPNYVNKSYNSVLHNSSNPNYKETLVAGVEGNYNIFPIPYEVGKATSVTY